MVNFSNENGDYTWAPEGIPYYDQITIPHAPVNNPKGCTCPYCEYCILYPQDIQWNITEEENRTFFKKYLSY